ncbi:MAG: hypothetical protein ACLT8E_00410 [Akkermansia sp.]
MTGEPFPSHVPGDKLIGATLNTTGTFTMTAQNVGMTPSWRVSSTGGPGAEPPARLAQGGRYFVLAVVPLPFSRFSPGILGPQCILAARAGERRRRPDRSLPLRAWPSYSMSMMVAGKAAPGSSGTRPLSTMHRVNILVMDKTGTLTEGRPSLVNVTTGNNVNMDAPLPGAPLWSRTANTPSRAFLQKAAEEKLTLSPIEDFQSFPGGGGRDFPGRRFA